jgi:hypothetical protein
VTRKRGFWVSARGLVVVLLAVLLSGCGNSTTEEYIIGYRGVARSNPFLAAERTLTALGCYVEHMQSIDVRGKSGGVLITNPRAFINYGDTDETMRWVHGGGHLVLLMSGSERWRSDFDNFDFKDFVRLLKQDAPSEESNKLLEQLGLKAEEHGFKVTQEAAKSETQVSIDDEKLKCFLPGELQFTREPRGDVRAGGTNPSLVSFERGEGRITILASAHPFRNRWLGEADHATLLWSIVQMGGDYQVWFCDGARMSFLAMLWSHGWMAIVAVGILIGVWLWKNLPRFGPLRAVQVESSRDFTTHLELTGAFLWRQHEARSLLAPTQRAVTAAIQRAGWHPTQADYFEKIAARTGLTVERTQDALTLNDTVESQRFQRLIQDLQIIREKF